MTQTIRKVIDAALDSWLHDFHNRAPTRTDAILAALAAAGIGTYDTRIHVAVPRKLSDKILDDIRHDTDVERSPAKWFWSRALLAAEAEAREAAGE